MAEDELETEIYIKVSDGGSHYIGTVEEAKATIESMAFAAREHGQQEEYAFSTVELTQEQFDNKPEFEGF